MPPPMNANVIATSFDIFEFYALTLSNIILCRRDLALTLFRRQTTGNRISERFFMRLPWGKLKGGLKFTASGTHVAPQMKWSGGRGWPENVGLKSRPDHLPWQKPPPSV